MKNNVFLFVCFFKWSPEELLVWHPQTFFLYIMDLGKQDSIVLQLYFKVKSSFIQLFFFFR